ncbi:hypothetical protein [Rugamonas sp.]|uniref:hypothetical protein n=1 Tax=Rugamonas sp. TaxID=1926287 RepID=UPI0025F8D54E|nr:hypothetical protein [Rugamonas sp.]
MSDAQLMLYSSWASIIGLAVSLVSLIYVRSIRANIVKFRRKQRIRQLTDEILRFLNNKGPLSSISLVKLEALKRNLPIHAWNRFSAKGRIKLAIHRFIDARDVAALREAINDLLSYSEDL